MVRRSKKIRRSPGRPALGEEDSRTRILVAAREVLNEMGERTTTNHIAEKASVSPGTLYHHFRNLEAVVFALYENTIAAVEPFWSSLDGKPPLTAFSEALKSALSLMETDRGFSSSFAVFLSRDPLLRSRYAALTKHRLGQLESIWKQLVAEKLAVGPDSESALRTLLESAWVCGTYWQSHLMSLNLDQSPIERRRGAEAVISILQPWLSSRALQVVQSNLLLNENN
jgi:AcrR family transcriptional regulator